MDLPQDGGQEAPCQVMVPHAGPGAGAARLAELVAGDDAFYDTMTEDLFPIVWQAAVRKAKRRARREAGMVVEEFGRVRARAE